MTKILVVGDFQGVFSKRLYKKIKQEDPDLIISVGDYAGINDWQPWLKDAFKQSKKGEEWLSPEEFFGNKKFKLMIKKDDEAAKNVLTKLNSFGKKAIFILGNTDDEWYQYPFLKRRGLDAKKWKLKFIKKQKNLINVNYGKTKHFGINFICFGGYMDAMANHEKNPKTANALARKNNAIKRLKLSEKKFERIIRGVSGSKVFVMHYPPRGVFDIVLDKSNPYYKKSSGVEFFAREIKKHRPKMVLCGHMHEYQGLKRFYGVPIINPGDAEKDKYAVLEINEKGNLVSTKFER